MNTRKQFLSLAAVFAAGLVSTQAQLLITEVYPAGSGNGTYAADWFELWNTGASAVDLTGWRVDDSSAAFNTGVSLRGVSSIAAGQRVIFLEGNATGTTDSTVNDAFRAAWFGGNVPVGLTLANYGGSGIGLSTGGDGLNLFDSGSNVVASVSFGTTTTGATLDNAAGLSGAISQTSVVGVNGAFTSFNGAEIGSPGLVPEPSAFALLGLGGLAVLAVRRAKKASA
jgi:hypothetical protein